MTWDELYRGYQSGAFEYPVTKQLFGSDYDWYDKQGAFNLMDSINNGSSSDYAKLQGILSQGPLGMSPEFTQWLQDMVSNQRTNEARSWDEMMRNTSYTSTAQQLAQLGLSSANVVQAGAASTPSGPVSQVSKDNVAMQKMQMKNQMAQNTIRTLGMLGSAGIHGTTLALAKKASSHVARNSALFALRHY